MNRTAMEYNIKKWRCLKISYLTSKVPKERYALFLRGNFLVFAGYIIATIETFIAIYLGLADLSYELTLFISLSVLSLTSVLISITFFSKNLLVWHEWFIFGVYLLTFLLAFCFWVYWLGDLRFLGILNALTAVTIVISYTNVVQSLLMSIPTLICYYTVTWYSIKIYGQQGSLMKEAFMSICLLPGFLLVSIAAYYIKKKRNDLLIAASKLENLNRELSDANEIMKKEQLVSEIEMDLAGEIQSAIFPGKVPRTSDWDVAFVTIPYGTVSGDFYDFYSKENSLKGISLFDVSGHGVAPALITILAKPVLYSYFSRCESSRLGVVMESANSDLLDQLEEVNLYITGLILRMNGPEVEYVNAGHPDLLHYRKSENKVRIIADPSNSFKGHPIGISGLTQTYPSFKFSVPSGDFLVFYSDGLTESRNYMGEQFGVSRLSDAVISSQFSDAKGLLKHIIESFKNFAGDIKAGDDITIVIAGKI